MTVITNARSDATQRSSDGAAGTVDPASALLVAGTTGPSAPVNKDAAKTFKASARRPVRLHPDTDVRLQYWADKHGQSANGYIVEAVEEKIRRENGDYDLPTLEIARLNQLTDLVGSLSSNVANLEAVVTVGFESLMGLTRGDNYLTDSEDGELGDAGMGGS
ncbi:hypothetical protein ANMWB30_23700 [Arthrobacter sp. MWB30]|nr:hypothetical protein ANMWB30_23700 [Arthrobacter sp. MWB30]